MSPQTTPDSSRSTAVIEAAAEKASWAARLASAASGKGDFAIGRGVALLATRSNSINAAHATRGGPTVIAAQATGLSIQAAINTAMPVGPVISRELDAGLVEGPAGVAGLIARS